MFDWEREFPEIMKRGGFDAVIGNPPYVRQEMLSEFKQYFQLHYKVYHGVADLYSYFIEKGVSLLRNGGKFSYIVANKWMRANYGEPLRRWMKGVRIEEIIDFGDLPVFKKATTYPCVIRVSKNPPEPAFRAVQVDSLDFSDLGGYVESACHPVAVSSLPDSGWSLAEECPVKLLEKIKKTGVPLGEYVQGKIFRGILTGLNEAFVIDEETRHRFIAEDSKSAEIIKPFLAGREIKRYREPKNDKYLIFPRRGIDIKKYPAIERYLSAFEEKLMPKPSNWKPKKEGEKWKGRKPGLYKWYEIQDSIDYYREFEKSKIIYPNICKRPEFTFDTEGIYTNQKCFIISIEDKYLLGLLNSKLNMFLFKYILPKLRGDFYEPSYVYFKLFPIRTIDFSSPADVARHDRMVSLVDAMLALNRQLAAAQTAQDKTAIQRQIDATDSQIDRLVYELYGLTEEEIGIVVGNAN